MIKNGIAYSGNTIECGPLDQKIINAIQNNIEFIQIRFKDIEDMITIDDKFDSDKLMNFINLIRTYSGKISVHLPNPVWDEEGIELSQANNKTLYLIQSLLIPNGITEFTIHPHCNRFIYESLNENQKENAKIALANYFAEIVKIGGTIGIENIPVRDIKNIFPNTDQLDFISYNIQSILKECRYAKDDENIQKQLLEKYMISPKQLKTLKNISFGMTIEEIEDILDLTRKSYVIKTSDPINALKRIGVTYDTGHSLNNFSKNDTDNQWLTEIEKWIDHFNNSIKFFHLTPSINKIEENGAIIDKVDLDKSTIIITTVFEKYINMELSSPIYIEAHASLDAMNTLQNLSEKIKTNINLNRVK